MSPYRNAPPPPSVRRLSPWKSKGAALFVLLVIVCTAWVVAPRVEPVRSPVVALRGPDGNAPFAAIWPAHIERSGIPGLDVDTACQISADLALREGPVQVLRTGPVMHHVLVRCGGRILYESTPNPATRQSLTQRFGKDPKTIVLAGAYDDGMPAGPRLRFDTTPPLRAPPEAMGTAHVHVGFGPDEGVDLAVARWSEPRVSAPLGPYANAAFDRSAYVRSATGQRPVPPGIACRVQMIPAAADRCDVTVDCRPAQYTGLFRNVACNANDAAGGAPLHLDDSMDRASGHGSGMAVLHFDSIDRPFSITSRVPDTWMLELTLAPKMD